VIAAFRVEDDAGRPTLERIVQHVGRQFRVELRRLRGRDRRPGTLWPRQLCMYLARRLTGQSLAQIGDYFGRDHSTVRHACQKVEDVLTTDAALPGLLRQLEAELG
jgi:chromosomal replication initiator protein